MQTKTCTSCGETKPIDQFRGKNHKCRKCDSLINKKWKENNKESMDIYRQKWIENNPEKIKVYIPHPRKTKEEKIKIETCEILKEHKEIMKDDPERLTTSFLKKIIHVDCSGKL